MASLIEPLKKSQATNCWAWFRDHDEAISLRTTLRDTKTGKNIGVLSLRPREKLLGKGEEAFSPLHVFPSLGNYQIN